jgi:hypothetical protein
MHLVEAAGSLNQPKQPSHDTNYVFFVCSGGTPWGAEAAGEHLLIVSGVGDFTKKVSLRGPQLTSPGAYCAQVHRQRTLRGRKTVATTMQGVLRTGKLWPAHAVVVCEQELVCVTMSSGVSWR